MSAPLLEARALSKRFGGLRAVENVDLEVGEHEIVALIGPNGAGKTTCFNVITGADRPTSGDVLFEGRSIAGLSPWRVAQRGIGRTFQNIRLFREMTALDNARTPFAHVAGYGLVAAVTRSGAFRRREREMEAKAREYLALVGLSGHADARARELSYGQQRRLEIARALALAPRLLLLDEPAAGMNPSEKVELASLVRTLRDRHGLTVLLIDHDMKFVMGLADRVYVLDHGVLLCCGCPKDVCADAKVVDAYLGKAAEGAS